MKRALRILFENLRWGFSWSAYFFLAFGVVGVIAFLGKNPEFEGGTLTYPQLLVTYLLTALVAGVLLGIFRPWARTMPGAAMIGLVTGAATGASLHVARRAGPWQEFDSAFTVLLALAGLAMGVALLRKSRRINAASSRHSSAS